MRRILAILFTVQAAAAAIAQEAPKSDEGPSIKVGATIFADYTYAQEPLVRDADGNEVHASSFNITRGYVNVTGNVNRMIAFRVTPDVTRESGTGSSLAGSMTFRLKYAYAQFNLDDWTRKGTWLRFGMQPTPFMEATEPLYRYRFQGSLFEDRENYEPTADTGISARTVLPARIELQGGIYNGTGYTRTETNNEKSLELRATWTPFATGIASGLRFTGYVHDDHYVARAPRRRLISQAAFTHPRVNAGFDYLTTKDRQSSSVAEVDGRGYTVWLEPKLGGGWEALLRHDELRPDTRASQTKKRDIEGIAYWVPLQKGLAAALMLDRDSTRGVGPTTTLWALKMMVSF